jgi:hypothetical protein
VNLERLADNEIAHSAEDVGDVDHVKQTKPELRTRSYRLQYEVLPFRAEMNTTPQREFWTGQPAELETMWTLRKSGKVARLVLLTHQLGWELRVESGDLLLTQVCRSDREIEDVSAAWRGAMIEKGWS